MTAAVNRGSRHARDRIPPHDLAAERAALGAALISPDAIKAIAHVAPSAFYDSRHAVVLSTIRALHDADEPVDPITVAAKLDGRLGIDKAFLLELQADTPASASAGAYARLIDEAARRRRRITLAGELAESGYTGTELPPVVVAELGDIQGFQADSRFERIALTLDDVEELEPPDWLVEGWMPASTLVDLFGPSGDGKTFLTISLALHICFDMWWHDRPGTGIPREVNGGPVVYVAAEAPTQLGKRVRSFRTHHNLTTADPAHAFTLIPGAVQLLDPTNVDALIALAINRGAVLIVLDTFARCFVGGDENSARDVGLAIAALDLIRTKTGACVLIVHHTGKDTGAGARGSSALRGAVDVELEHTASSDGITLKNSKQKDYPEAANVRLRLLPVDDSCVIVPASTDNRPTDLTAGMADTLDALRRIDIPSGVKNADWLDAVTCAKSTFNEHRARLIERGLVANLGSDYAPRYSIPTPNEEETHPS